MTIKTIITSAVAVIVGVPMAVVLIAIGWISVLDRTSASLVLSGETRRYLLHVPASYDPRTPTPLVISMHAGATWPAHQANLSHWNRLADEHGFIVVYPSGTPAVFNVARIWRTTPETVMADVRFLSALIDTLEAAYTIDPARIYANGMSLGGGMAFALSCALPDRIAAVGVVAAAQTPLPELCTGTRPMPLMAFHGDADPIVPYGGGPLGDPFNPVKPVYPPVQGWVANAAQRNQCGVEAVKSMVASDVRRTTYPACAGGADVVLYTLLGAGHSWPGGKPPPTWRVGATNTSIDATVVMWEFFESHPLRQR